MCPNFISVSVTNMLERKHMEGKLYLALTVGYTPSFPYLCACLCVCMHMSTWILGFQKREMDSLELEMSDHTWVLQTKLKPCGRTTRAPNHNPSLQPSVI